VNSATMSGSNAKLLRAVGAKHAPGETSAGFMLASRRRPTWPAAKLSNSACRLPGVRITASSCRNLRRVLRHGIIMVRPEGFEPPASWFVVAMMIL
jgi:hypothetical protein